MNQYAHYKRNRAELEEIAQQYPQLSLELARRKVREMWAEME